MKGKAIAEGAKVVKQSAWPDFVFAPDYPLISLPELKTYIIKNHHLPEIPDAKTVKATGVDVGETSALLLRKTEELTLYLLHLDERLKTIEDSRNQSDQND